MKILMIISGESDRETEHVGVLIRELQQRGHTVCLCSLAGGPTAGLPGTVHYTLPAGHGRTAARTLAQILATGGVDIVHAHTPAAADALALAEKQHGTRRGYRVCLTCGTSSVRKKQLHSGDGIIVRSEQEKDALIRRYGIFPDLIAAIPEGVPVPGPKGQYRAFLLETAAEYEVPSAERTELVAEQVPVRVLAVCGEKLRAVFSAVQARFVSVFPEVGFTVLSPGAPGFSELLSGADLFLGSGQEALCAMAQGIPVFLADEEGYFGPVDTENQDLAARNGYSCRGCASPEPEFLFRDLLSWIALPPEVREELGRHLRERVIAESSVEAEAERTLAFYGQLLSGAGVARLMAGGRVSTASAQGIRACLGSWFPGENVVFCPTVTAGEFRLPVVSPFRAGKVPVYLSVGDLPGDGLARRIARLHHRKVVRFSKEDAEMLFPPPAPARRIAHLREALGLPPPQKMLAVSLAASDAWGEERIRCVIRAVTQRCGLTPVYFLLFAKDAETTRIVCRLVGGGGCIVQGVSPAELRGLLASAALAMPAHTALAVPALAEGVPFTAIGRQDRELAKFCEYAGFPAPLYLAADPPEAVASVCEKILAKRNEICHNEMMCYRELHARAEARLATALGMHPEERRSLTADEKYPTRRSAPPQNL